MALKVLVEFLRLQGGRRGIWWKANDDDDDEEGCA